MIKNILQIQLFILIITILIGCATKNPVTVTPVNLKPDDVAKQLKVLDKNDPRGGVFFKSDSFGNIQIK